MFEKLPYKSKIKICELFYMNTHFVKLEKFLPIEIILPKRISFSWSWISIETEKDERLYRRVDVEKWYNINQKIIRNEKLSSIRKRETLNIIDI